MNHEKDLNWLKKNKYHLTIAHIAKSININSGTLQGTLNGTTDGHGTPHKIPKRYHENLSKVINEIRKR